MSKPIKINFNFQGVTPVERPNIPAPWECSWAGWDLVQSVDYVNTLLPGNHLPCLEVAKAVEDETGRENDYVILEIDESQIDEIRQLADCTVITFNGTIPLESLIRDDKDLDADLHFEQYGIEISYEGIDKVLIYRHDGEQGPHWQTVVL